LGLIRVDYGLKVQGLPPLQLELLRAAELPLHVDLERVVDAAVDLLSDLCRAPEHICGGHLRHRSERPERLAERARPRGLVRQDTAALDLGCDVGKGVGDALETPDLAPELLALVGIRQRELECAL